MAAIKLDRQTLQWVLELTHQIGLNIHDIREEISSRIDNIDDTVIIYPKRNDMQITTADRELTAPNDYSGDEEEVIEVYLCAECGTVEVGRTEEYCKECIDNK